MVAIDIAFPGGRYHATPWDAHVNEGLVEWPPSPWRLLRALVATWHRKARDEVSEETARAIVEKLAGALPRYSLPRATASHTRHYMPLGAPGKTTRVFDAFVQVADGESLCVSWPVSLPPEERASLALLADRLGYLGRAESWTQARLREDEPDGLPVGPADVAEGGHGETVRLAAPVAPPDYASWRRGVLDGRAADALRAKREANAQKGKAPDGAKLSKKEQDAIEASLPADLFEALHAETSELRKAGWSQPPGSRFVSYLRPHGALSATASRVPKRPRRLPTTARFAVASQVLPSLTDAVHVAERVRKALLARSDRALVFAGRDESGRVGRGHQHAFILPEAAGRGGRITHVTLHAPMGFDEVSRRALDSLSKVWGSEGHDLQLVLLGVGFPEDFGGLPHQGADRCALLAESRVWESRTPFVPTRHPKASRSGEPKLDASGLQVASPEHDLRRLLAALVSQPPDHVEPLEGTLLGDRLTRWLAFRTQRTSGHGSRGTRAALGYRLTFAEPVRGPIAVGYGAHFGLGVFRACSPAR